MRALIPLTLGSILLVYGTSAVETVVAIYLILDAWSIMFFERGKK